MHRFCLKTLAFGDSRARTSCVPSLRWFSKISDEEPSFVASYLINSLGFCPKAASMASRHVKFDSPDKPDKVIEFFKSYGFTQTQLANLARASPKILLCNSQKTIKPKFEFFISNGIWSPKLIQGLSCFPAIMVRSLTRQIVPAYCFLRRLFDSDGVMIDAVSRNPDILSYDIKNRVEPNIFTLSQYGVPHSKIASLIYNSPQDIVTNPVQFRVIVKEVAEMGFRASKTEFVLALRAVRQKRRGSKWVGKVRAFKKSGWSDEEVLKAFRKFPLCMMVSEDKIAQVIGFFVEKMGMKPGYLAENPTLFSLSLEKRIIPRISYYEALLSRDLVEKELKLLTLLMISEKAFLQKFVTPFAEEIPELMKLYKEKFSDTATTRHDIGNDATSKSG